MPYRRVPKRRYQGPQGTIYLLHFSTPYKHAKHYVGFVEASRPLDERLAEHANGIGSRLMAAVVAAGIGFIVAKLWTGDRLTERSLKGRGGAARICPICQAHTEI